MRKPTMICASSIHPVWSVSLLCAQWVATDPRFLHPLGEDWSGWVDAQADLSLCWPHRSFCWVLLCCGSIEPHHEKTCLNVICLQKSAYQSVVRCLVSVFAKSQIPRIGSPCSRADQFESYMAKNPKDRFSRDAAQMRQRTVELTKWHTLQILRSARTALGS